MKTIEEIASEYAHKYRREVRDLSGERADAAFAGFIVGAKSEREELLRWHDPKKELPAEWEDVLIKLITGKCEVGFYIKYLNWRGSGVLIHLNHLWKRLSK